MYGVLNLASATQDDPVYSQDTNTNLTLKLIYSTIHDEISSLLKYNECGMTNLRSSTIKKFVERLENIHFNIIGTLPKANQEMFLLHQICKSLYIYNDQCLNLSHQEFRAKVLYPNLVYMLVRRFTTCYRFLQHTIKCIYEEIKRHSYGIIQRYTESYYLDHEMIKTDILYEFLGNLLRKIDPLTVNNLTYFYKQTFRNIFHYYFRNKQEITTTYSSVWDIDTSVSQLISYPTRLSIYRDVLYTQQIQKMCKSSPTIMQISYNYNIFKNIIINNELQNMVLSNQMDIISVPDNQYKLLKIYKNEQANNLMMEELKELPIIYRLLKCVHIVNPKVKPYNEMMIKPEMLKLAILDELSYPFRNMFNEAHVHGILDKISDNFINSILTGEYINLLTLSSVRITQISFITQIRKFINICINGVLNGETR